MAEGYVAVEGSLLTVKFEDGHPNVSENTILEHHPSITPLLDEIKSNGWKYGFSMVSGVAVATVDLSKKEFSIHYMQPDLVDGSGGYYYLDTHLGEELPAKLEVKTISGFEIEISTPKFRNAATINTFKNEMHLHNALGRHLFTEEDRPLADTRELYVLAKWLAGKNFTRDEYAEETYQNLIKLFEHNLNPPLGAIPRTM